MIIANTPRREFDRGKRTQNFKKLPEEGKSKPVECVKQGDPD